MNPICAPLLTVLRDPTQMARFDENTWDRLIRHAEASGLLGRIGALAVVGGLIDTLPTSVAHHLQAAYNLAEQQRRSVRWELHHLGRALRDFPGRVVLLKGAAYVAGDLAPAAGRLFSDIDLLVSKAHIDEAESCLMLSGWISSHHDAYDQRYYREWMHELPPMRHLGRGTVLDLHHSILPETARIKTHPDSLLADAIALPAFPGFHILQPVDQVLHSATHLFHEGEWEHGLRDLVDLDALLRAYASQEQFWQRLLMRANTLNLGRPLYYALRYASRLLATPVPQFVLDDCPARPSAAALYWMDRQFLAAFSSAHSACQSPFASVALSFLYLRSHWLRMPAGLLLPHLIRKAWKKRVDDWKQGEEQTVEAAKTGQERRDVELR